DGGEVAPVELAVGDPPGEVSGDGGPGGETDQHHGPVGGRDHVVGEQHTGLDGVDVCAAVGGAADGAVCRLPRHGDDLYVGAVVHDPEQRGGAVRHCARVVERFSDATQGETGQWTGHSVLHVRV